MPRYFFDVKTEELQVCDQVGIDLPNQHAIWPEIARLIHDCLHAAPLKNEGRVFDVTVRDEAGMMIERCTSTVPSVGPHTAADHQPVTSHPAP